MPVRAKLAILLVTGAALVAALAFLVLNGDSAPEGRPPAGAPAPPEPRPVPSPPEGTAPEAARKEASLPAGETEPTAAPEPGSSVSGRVLDAGGQPIRGAVVRPAVSADTVDPSDARLSAALALSAETDAAGRYALGGLPPRKDYVLHASRPDFAPTSLKELALGEEESLEGVDLVLLRGGGIRGRVTDEEEKGIAGASLRVSLKAGEDDDDDDEDEEDGSAKLPFRSLEPAGAPQAQTGADGSYEISHLPAGTYTVEARDPSSTRLPGRREKVEVLEGKTAERVDIALVTGESLAGRVLDTDGNTVAAAKVLASGKTSSQALSDEEGNFRITGLRRGPAHINVVKKGFETVIAEATVPAEDAVFTMVPRGAIVGTVRAQGQERFPEFRIAVSCQLSNGERWESFVECRDPGGRFEVEGQAGVYVLTARVPGFAPSGSPEITLAPRERREGVVIELLRGETIRGKVIVRGSGAPIEGAWVSASADRKSGERWAGGSQSTRSGPDGSFAIEGVPEGTVEVEATSYGQYTENKVKGIRVQSGIPTELLIELGEGGRIRGTTVRGGKPLSGARLSAMRHGDFVSREALSDSEGRFEIKGLEEGDYSLRAMAALPGGAYTSWRSVHVVVRDGQATEVDLVEGAPVRVWGRVTSGGLPLAGGAVRAEQIRSGDAAKGKIDAAGGYSLDLAGSGSYLLTIQAKDKESGGARVEAIVPAGAREVRRDIELPSGEITGAVVDAATGAAIAGAQVWAFAGEAPSRSFLALHRSTRSMATTDASGRFVLSSLPPGGYSLRAFADGYADGHLEAIKVDENGGGSGRIALERGVPFEARVVDPEGRPVSGALVFLRTTGGELVLLEPAASSDDGAVKLPAPRPGTYRVCILHGSHAPFTGSVQAGVGLPTPTLALGRGGKLRLRVADQRGKPVEGGEVQVLNEEGEDLIEDLVLLQGALRRTFLTQVDGSLVLEHAAGGSYRLTARKGEARSREVRVTVVEGETAELSLTVSE